MEEKNRCYRCKHMDRYYVKETTCYRKTRFGRCRKRDENVGIHDGCGSTVRRITAGKARACCGFI